MSAVISLVLFLAVVGALIAVGVRIWQKRARQQEGGLDLIPYLLLALAVGVTGFSLAALARAALGANRIAGEPTTQIAAALAGIVVAGPVAFFLWRRQSERRRTYPHTPGWPIYLALIELVFLTTFLVSVAQVADSLFSRDRFSGETVDWTNLIVYGALVGFHWWVGHREPPQGDAGELPRVVGAGVALIAMAIASYGTLNWLLAELYEAMAGSFDVPDPAIPISLIVFAAPIWAWRWLPAWADKPSVFRHIYLAVVSAASLTTAVGALVTILSLAISFLIGERTPAARHFRLIPTAVAVLLVAGAVWLHHRRVMGPERTAAVRGYQYVMAATGLGALVGTGTALVIAAFEPALAGSDRGQALIALGCATIAAGALWLWFWRLAQAAPGPEEIRALPRRIYLIGMAITTGLTSAGALIGTLVVVFRAILGEGEPIGESIRFPLTLTILSGLAAWHLFFHLRRDGEGMALTEVKPFSVTVICSHPGTLATLFPKQATLRVIYRGDSAGSITEAMAGEIVEAVAGRSSLVWVDDSGYRVAPARES